MKPSTYIRIFLFGMVMLTGCIDGRDSLHELDHVVPSHWPKDLEDAARKLTEKSQSFQGDAQTQEVLKVKEWSEFKEIIEWLPDIAADTQLEESEWVEIYNHCESLRAMTRSSAVEMQQLDSKVRQLCDTLLDRHALLREREKSTQIAMMGTAEPNDVTEAEEEEVSKR